MIFVWLLAGCVAVTAAYFLPGPSTQLWPNIDSAGLVLAVYVVALLVAFARKKDVTPRRRIVVIAFSVVALGLSSFAWMTVKGQTQWQANRINAIGTTISRGIYNSAMADSLLNVLEVYYHQQPRGGMTIGQAYALVYPNHPQGDSMSTHYRNPVRDDPRSVPYDIFVTAVSDTHVVWVAQHPWFKGRDTAFAGFGGRKGLVQIRATLTERGVNYVTEN